MNGRNGHCDLASHCGALAVANTSGLHEFKKCALFWLLDSSMKSFASKKHSNLSSYAPEASAAASNRVNDLEVFRFSRRQRYRSIAIQLWTKLPVSLISHPRRQCSVARWKAWTEATGNVQHYFNSTTVKTATWITEQTTEADSVFYRSCQTLVTNPQAWRLPRFAATSCQPITI